VIARDVEITDLDPRVWKNLPFFWKKTDASEMRMDYPNMLSILHDQGRLLRICAPKEHGTPDIKQIDDPQELAKKLFYQYPGIERVQILEKHSVQIYSSKVQKLDWSSLDYDEFFLSAIQLADEDPAGLCFYPPRNTAMRGFSIPAVRDWVLQLPSPSSLLIGVYKDSAPWFTLVLRFSEKKIRLITTFAYFSRFGADTSRLPSAITDLDPICALASQHIAPVAAALVCDFSVAEQLTLAANKKEILNQAIASGSAAIAGNLFP
jgi:hypothetical protein